MILVDMNQLTISHIMAESKGKPLINENLIRHMILNNIRLIRNKYKAQYGEIVLCYDSMHNWRREIFPNYKARRKKNREKSEIDWNSLHNIMDKIREELIAHFPYKVMKIDCCEADDIIAILTRELSSQEPILILSSDEDFIQLQKYPNVSQYSLIQKKFLKTNDPKEFVFQHVIDGDSGDDVPNILSEDDCFVTEGKRQVPLTAKRKNIIREEWVKNGFSTVPSKFENSDQITKNIERNTKLIDFDNIPGRIKEIIITTYNTTIPAKRDGLLNYFIAHGLGNLMDTLTEF